MKAGELLTGIRAIKRKDVIYIYRRVGFLDKKIKGLEKFRIKEVYLGKVVIKKKK